ncbi:MAG: TonB-dependent receptor [Pseudomonadota bacterium]
MSKKTDTQNAAANRNSDSASKDFCPRVVPLAVAVTVVTFTAAKVAAQETDARESRYSLMEEVVITAQKREQDYLSVPVTVNAFTAQDMINTGAATIQEIDQFMPGVEIGDPIGGSTQLGITVRGVRSPNISSGQDPSVATFYDGSYMPRAVTSIPFTDIARTEVLKGPQGTLFGRNATAGVINIVPNKPSQEFEGFAKLRLGTKNWRRLEAMVNVPVNDSLALRANVFSQQRDGLTKSVTGGDDFRDEGYTAFRGVALWSPTDATSVQLAVDFENRDEMPRPAIGVSRFAFNGSSDPFRGRDQHDVVGAGGVYDASRNNEEETRDMYGVSLQINHAFDDRWSAFGIVSYRDWETTNLQEEDGTAAARRYLDTNNIEDSDIFYSELRFNFVTDKINLVFGGNYSSESVFQRTDIGLLTDSYMQFLSGQLLPFAQDAGFISPDVVLDQTSHIWDFFGESPDEVFLGFSQLATELTGAETAVLPQSFAGQYFTETMDNTGDFVNWGLFADARYQLTDSVGLTAGLRYNFDEKDYSWQTFDNSLDWPFALFRVNYDPSQTGASPDNFFDQFATSDDWSRVTGRLVVDWQFAENAMLFASYATGYKSGGFDGQSFRSFQAGSFDPEEMTSYEIGLKGDFFGDQLRAEISLFHQELEGRQRSEDIKDSPDDPTAAPGVVSSDDEADGIEILLSWNVTDTLRLGALTTWRENEEVSEPFFNAAGEPAGGEVEVVDATVQYTLKFDWIPNIPVGDLLWHMNYVFTEDPGPDANEAIFVTGPWYFQDRKLLNTRIAWSNDDGNIEVALWGNNLLDEETAENPGGLAAADLGAIHTRIDETRTWGVDLRYSF